MYGYNIIEEKIYRIKNNKLHFIGTTEYNTASCRGAVHECFQKLMEIGEIPKKYEKSSICEWRGSGYFYGEVTEKYSIQEI